jgi:hypothetical protein
MRNGRASAPVSSAGKGVVAEAHDQESGRRHSTEWLQPPLQVDNREDNRGGGEMVWDEEIGLFSSLLLFIRRAESDLVAQES